eukprot:5366009-Pleurochrysis_carterae.AAC.1
MPPGKTSLANSTMKCSESRRTKPGACRRRIETNSCRSVPKSVKRNLDARRPRRSARMCHECGR